MKHKRVLVILISIILIILSTLLFVVVFKLGKPNLESYDKYGMDVVISYQGELEPIWINVKYSKDKSIVTTNYTKQDVFIVDKKIQYVDGRNIYTNTQEYFYQDIYNIFKPILSDIKNKEEISVDLTSNQVNEILKCLYFNRETKHESNALIKIYDNKIDSVEFSIGDFPDYPSLKVSIDYKALDENFEVNTDILDSDALIPSKRKKIKEISSNILDISLKE